VSILVVGSAALDDIETPFGTVRGVLGGSSIYAAAAASLFCPVNLVAVVGEDLPASRYAFLAERGVDLTGLQVRPGKTFHWAGRYDYDLNQTHTLTTELNVFADFQPVLPPAYRQSAFVFLANIQPGLQRAVLGQVQQPQLTLLDSMNLWIESARAELTQALAAVDLVSLNEAEVRLFAGTSSVVTAARRLLALGPKGVLVKKGEYGVVLFSAQDYFACPAYPLEEVYDPTGAGDSFAGGFLGALAEAGEVSAASLRRAVLYGSAVASFTVQAFGVERLTTLRRAEVDERCRAFQRMTQVGAL